MENFVWTEELVLEFAKVSQQGSYDEYRGCKKIEQKLEKFKEIKSRNTTVVERTDVRP